MRWIAGLALALGLVACAARPQWTKEGVSPEMVAQALAGCRSEAQEALQRDTNIDTDILASRGTDWRQAGEFGAMVDLLAFQNRRQSQDLITRCMIAKGYAPGA